MPDPEAAAALSGDALRSFMEAVIEDAGASLALRKHVAARYPVAAGRSPAPQRPQRTGGRAANAAGLRRAAGGPQPALSPAPRLRRRPQLLDPARHRRHQRGDAAQSAGSSWSKGPVGRVPRGRRRRRRGEVLRAGRPRRPAAARPGRLGAVGGQPAVPSADGLRGGDEDHRALRAGARPAGALAAAAERRERQRRPHLRPAADASARTRCARPTPSTARTRSRCCSATSRPSADDPGDHMPGSRVYTCLSHDIVAHETTHAILDGMHRRFNEPTNPTCSRCTRPSPTSSPCCSTSPSRRCSSSEIGRTRGDLEAESMLGSLAVQFGRATGGRGALRDAIGRLENGVWTRFAARSRGPAEAPHPALRAAPSWWPPCSTPSSPSTSRAPPTCSASTPAAPASCRTARSTPTWSRRLADEAAKSAEHVLNMCIRALDYLPPVDVTFFEYLRALITADYDLVSDDRHNYRVAFVEAFRRRGIYPLNLAAPSADTPRTLSVGHPALAGARPVELLQESAGRDREAVRRRRRGPQALRRRLPLPQGPPQLFERDAQAPHRAPRQLRAAFEAVPEFAVQLGLDPADRFEVHELRRAMRVSSDGRYIPQVVVALTQSKTIRQDGHPAATSSAAARPWSSTSRFPRSSTGSPRTSRAPERRTAPPPSSARPPPTPCARCSSRRSARSPSRRCTRWRTRGFRSGGGAFWLLSRAVAPRRVPLQLVFAAVAPWCARLQLLGAALPPWCARLPPRGGAARR